MHFSVLIKGENIDEQLSPFDENMEVYEVVKTKEELINEFRLATEEDLSTLSEDEIYEKAIEYFAYDDADIDKKTGDIVHTWNDDGHWDWYEIGGRWAGSIKLKDIVDPSQYSLPNFSWGWDETRKLESISNASVDQARKKDIANLDEISSYAFIKDGVWYDSDSTIDFPRLLREFIESFDDEDLMTIVDCHD